MLNPHLYLNEKLFDKDVELKATREGYGDGLVVLGDTDPNVVVLTADLNESTKNNKFSEKYPDRFFDCGVAEQNMAAIAAGLGVSRKTAFISSYATFSPGKNWETVRTTIVYNNANVKVAGHHAGIMTGADGPTHQATEDIAITRCWPGITIFVPCDSIEAEKATILAGRLDGPFYLRFTRDKTPVITTQDTPFSLHGMNTYWVSINPQVSIFSTGYMLYYSLLAAKELEDEGIQTQVINTSVIKPLNEEIIYEAARKTDAVVSVEDHQVAGGLGSAISEVLARCLPTPMEFVGLHDTFAESGSATDLLTKYGMDKEAIKQAVRNVIRRKR